MDMLFVWKLDAMLYGFLIWAVTRCAVQGQEMSPVYEDEYCETETFHAECAVGEVIVMQSAFFGRMQIGRCVETNLGYLGCHADVLRIADRRCSGRRICEIRVPDAELVRMKPCMKELKSYLNVSYVCMKVETIPNEHCERHSEINITTSSHGFIASTTMLDIPYCDGSSNPWYIIALPGQQINLTMYDFSASVTYGALDPNSEPEPDQDMGEIVEMCDEYGMVEDPLAEKTTPICGGVRRVARMYLSKGHFVKVWVTNSRDTKYFLLEYTVIGCPDLVPIEAETIWFRRSTHNNMEAEMGCVYSDVSWKMICKNHMWSGIRKNCSLPVAEEHDEQLHGRKNFPFTYGIAIAIIIGAALGIAFVIFIVILVRYRRGIRGRDGGHNRETITLQQREAGYDGKIPIKSNSHSPTNCLLDDHQTKIPNTNASDSPVTPLCRHQRHPVKVNGNEYEHIWESPLPHPYAAGDPVKSDLHCTIKPYQKTIPMAHAAALSFSTFKTPDVLTGTYLDSNHERPLYVSSKDILGSPTNSLRRAYEKGRYSSLDRCHDKRLIQTEDKANANV